MRRNTLAFCLALGTFLVSTEANALRPGPGGMFETGMATKFDNQGRMYSLVHTMRDLPAQKTAQGVINADTDKQFVLFAYRELSCSDIKAIVRSGLDRAGQPSTNSGSFVGACNQGKLKPRAKVFLRYQASTKTTTFSVEGGTSASLQGVGPMKAVWSSFLLDSPKFSSALVARL